jgi:hypothetical protein
MLYKEDFNLVLKFVFFWIDSVTRHPIFIAIESAPANDHHLAQSGDGVDLHLLPDKVVSQLDSSAKKTAAFFNISRSMVSRLISC